MKLIIVGIIAGLRLFSAETVGTPVLGIVRQGPEVRRLHGMPGAMDPGDAVHRPEGTTLAQSAPRQEWMVLDRDGEWLAFDWQRGTLARIGAPADVTAFSSSGHEAVLISSGSSTFRMVTGLPGDPRVVEYELPGVSTVTRAAISVGAQQVALWGGDRLVVVEPGGTAMEWYRSEGVLSMVFVPGEAALVVADLHQSAVLRVEPGQSPRILLGAEDGLDVASAVWAGSRGRLAVISAKRELLWTFADGVWRYESIPGLARCEEMQLPDTLLLQDADGRPLRVHAFGTEQRSYEMPGFPAVEEVQQ